MVVVHVKGGAAEENEFLHECPSSSQIEELVESIVEIHNLQSKIRHLSVRVRDRLFSQGRFPDAAPVPLQRALSEAEAYASKDQVLCKRPLSTYVLCDHLRSIEKEVMAFLDFDASRLSADFPEPELLDEGTTQIWWAGKQLIRVKKLSDYIGGNVKTKEGGLGWGPNRMQLN